MHPFFRAPAIIRLNPHLAEPAPVSPPRQQGSRRPHTDAKVEAVRHLIEDTPLNYDAISKKTGVGRATICRWTRDHGWTRHLFAPRATDTIPRPRAGQHLKLRLLAQRLCKLADRCVREVEDSTPIDPLKLLMALEAVKMARHVAQGKRRKHGVAPKDKTGIVTLPDKAVLDLLREMHAHGVELDRAPEEAMAMIIDAHTPVEVEHVALRRGRGRGKVLAKRVDVP